MALFSILVAILVRLVLLVHSLLVIWLATSMTRTKEYWLLTIANLGMLVESIITIVKNKGQEWKWFCPCFFFYLCSTIPGIWILELNRMDEYQQKQSHLNTTVVKAAQVLDDIQGIHIPIEMETDTWVIIMEQLFLYLMILARWILPRGAISRDELSQLLFVFIGIASDITELFALFEENKVRESTGLTYAILCVWTVSLLQFTFVLTSTNSPKKTRVAIATEGIETEIEIEEEDPGCIKEFFQTEVWSICVNFLLQDGPFLAVRLYSMIALKLLTYSIIFFTAKNALLVMLLVYRLTVLCVERRHRKQHGTGSHVSSFSSKQSIGVSENNHSYASNGKNGSTHSTVKNRSIQGSRTSLNSQGAKHSLKNFPAL